MDGSCLSGYIPVHSVISSNAWKWYLLRSSLQTAHHEPSTNSNVARLTNNYRLIACPATAHLHKSGLGSDPAGSSVQTVDRNQEVPPVL